MTVLLSVRDTDFSRRLAALLAARGQTGADVNAAACGILAQARQHGGEAVVHYIRTVDPLPSLTMKSMCLPQAGIDQAADSVPDTLMTALHQAAGRVRAYHPRQMPANHDHGEQTGVFLGLRCSAVNAAGLLCPAAPRPAPSLS